LHMRNSYWAESFK